MRVGAITLHQLGCGAGARVALVEQAGIAVEHTPSERMGSSTMWSFDMNSSHSSTSGLRTQEVLWTWRFEKPREITRPQRLAN